MKRILTCVLLLFATAGQAQEFWGATGPITDNGGQDTYYDCSVSGLPSKIDSSFGFVEITINITHSDVKQLTASLISPWGTKVDLIGTHAVSGANFTGTTFRSDQQTSVTLGVAPFTGTFRPVGYFGRFNTGKSPNGTWKLEVKDFVMGTAGTVSSWAIRFGQNPPAPVVLQSSNLPIVFINTNNAQIGENEIITDFGIIDNKGARNFVTDPRNAYDGKAAVHLRGSSSRQFEKKNMKVELRDNSGQVDVEVPLLGMSQEHDWILTAFYNDKSLMRNALTHHLFTKMGRWSPRFRYVELVINGEYYGIYLLMEQIKRGDERIRTMKMTELDNHFPQLTGGYIVQINRSDDPGWYSMFPGVSTSGAKFYYQYNYPKEDRITQPQKDYIKAVLDSFETVMNGPDFADPKKGYRKLIDDNSFVDHLIISELAKNVDAYKLSTYLYKDNVLDGGKLRMGPPWDYDLAWHNVNFGDAFNEKYWQYKQNNSDYAIPTWWTKLMEDGAFQDKVYCRYHSLRLNVLSNNQIYSFIDETAAMLSEARSRNFRQFPIIGTYVYGNPQEQQGITYEKEIEHLKQWVAKRSQWLDENVPGYCQDVGVAELAGESYQIKAYPNPFSQRLHINYKLSDQCKSANISLFDVTGASAMSPVAAETAVGEHRVDIDPGNLPAGVYLMELDIDGKKFHSKVVKAPR